MCLSQLCDKPLRDFVTVNSHLASRCAHFYRKAIASGFCVLHINVLMPMLNYYVFIHVSIYVSIYVSNYIYLCIYLVIYSSICLTVLKSLESCWHDEFPLNRFISIFYVSYLCFSSPTLWHLDSLSSIFLPISTSLEYLERSFKSIENQIYCLIFHLIIHPFIKILI